MKLIVGLGNPGAQYAGTRHNVGFMAADYIAAKHDIAFSSSKGNGVYGKGKIGHSGVIVIKPQTYMNLSGNAVLALTTFYKFKPEDIIVVYDDFALELGKLRVRKQGSAGGHNGVQSIIDAVGQNFVRVRVGIGSPLTSTVDYVLSRFQPEEKKVIDQTIETVNNCIQEIVNHGVAQAMNKFNGGK